MRRAAILFTLVCLASLVVFPGCELTRFYGQAAAGEYQILARQKSIAELLADPATPPRLQKKLAEILDIREFAARELKLPTEDAYLKYVDLHREYVVWTVVVAPALSEEPKTWWFPIVGRASYRGYFKESEARRYADQWAKKGWDVYVGDVPTYSTLGWFRDPLLNTFIFEPEADLAELIFHELGHRRLFVMGDTEFNEAFATAVASEGIRRWFLTSGNTTASQEYKRDRQEENDFVKLVLATQAELTKVYHDKQLSGVEKLARKKQIIEELRAHYAQMKARWGVKKSGYDEWFSEPINNAKLATVSAYYDLTPAFEALLRAKGGDMEKFYAAVHDLMKMPLERRHAVLRSYLSH
jgi:predicted aminopeptidase